ncbi:MAG TPA: hypothetical protein PKD24_12485 [Pyrinomonadaceae bacterium]|nr:hypothetical protein [Pyrinomonadaceae bacterium]HMP66510.1 hypothetical protein [Pyrinomonadaceae bacterium]
MQARKCSIIFPHNESIGTVFVFPSETYYPVFASFSDKLRTYSLEDFWEIEEIKDVKGEILVRADDSVVLTISDKKRLSLLSALDAASLDGLYIANSVEVPVIPYFSHLVRLRHLGLSKHCGTDETLSYASNLYRLTHLFLNYSINVTDRGLEYLSDEAPISHLALLGTSVTGRCLARFAERSTLQWLDLYRSDAVTVDGLSGLASLTSLTHVTLGPKNVTDDTLSFLSPLTRLQCLCISGTDITDKGIAHLSTLRSLKYLDLADCAISDRSLPVLSELTSLKELFVNETRITSDGVEELRSVLPFCEIFI